jgi:hypothetical protein
MIVVGFTSIVVESAYTRPTEDRPGAAELAMHMLQNRKEGEGRGGEGRGHEIICEKELENQQQELPGAPATRNALDSDRGKSSYFSRFCDSGGVAESKAAVGSAAKRKDFTSFIKEQCVHASACYLPDLARCKPRNRKRHRTLVHCALTKLAVSNSKMRNEQKESGLKT